MKACHTGMQKCSIIKRCICLNDCWSSSIFCRAAEKLPLILRVTMSALRPIPDAMRLVCVAEYSDAVPAFRLGSANEIDSPARRCWIIPGAIERTFLPLPSVLLVIIGLIPVLLVTNAPKHAATRAAIRSASMYSSTS